VALRLRANYSDDDNVFPSLIADAYVVDNFGNRIFVESRLLKHLSPVPHVQWDAGYFELMPAAELDAAVNDYLKDLQQRRIDIAERLRALAGRLRDEAACITSVIEFLDERISADLLAAREPRGGEAGASAQV
ncbi:MAG: hypothetical protein H5T86_09345, partial [Armatimonadetes bacterium]|nr:hypothetical protein [Armatimonadota bacterium]